jgi:hypothetical protein
MDASPKESKPTPTAEMRDSWFSLFFIGPKSSNPDYATPSKIPMGNQEPNKKRLQISVRLTTFIRIHPLWPWATGIPALTHFPCTSETGSERPNGGSRMIANRVILFRGPIGFKIFVSKRD